MLVNIVKVGNKNTIDFSEIMVKATLSGDESNVARKLEFTVVINDSDESVPKVNITVGNKIVLYHNKEVLFEGYVFSLSHTHKDFTVTYTAYDPLIYLLKNEGSYSFSNTTAEDITKKILNEFKLPVGNIAKTKIAYKRVHIGVPLYEIIMHAYSRASKQNGKKYMMVFNNGKISVVEKGTTIDGFILQNKVNLTNSSYTLSIDGMVNKVVIVDKHGRIQGDVKNNDWIDSYGTLQKVFQPEQKTNTEKLQSSIIKKAKSMLEDVNKKANVNGLGDIRCITGRCITVMDGHTNVTGKFLIIQDTHTFERHAKVGDYSYTMELTLKFRGS